MADEIRQDDEQIFDLPAHMVGEMGTLDAAGTDIPVSQKLVDKIKAQDPDAKFAVFEIEPAISGSRRNWKNEHFVEMAKIINEKHPVAYKGHIAEKDVHTAFPTIHAIWLGAKVIYEKGKAKLQTKCYLKTPEIRDEIALEMVDSISPYGNIVMRPTKGGLLDVVSFSMESMDFARKGRNGLPARLVSVGSEMSTEGKGGKVEASDIAALQEAELRAGNPLLVRVIEDAVKAPLEKTVGEMTTAAEVVKPEIDIMATLRKTLGLGENDNPVDSVVELQEAVEGISKTKIKDFIKAAIKGKVKSEKAQALVMRMVGEQIESGFTKFEGDDEKLEKEIGEKVDKTLSDDDDVKAIVGEMTDTRSGRTDNDGGGRSFERKSQRPRESKGGERTSRSGGVTFSKTTRNEL